MNAVLEQERVLEQSQQANPEEKPQERQSEVYDLPISERYESIKLLIYKTVHQFKAKRGGDFDDMLSSAHMAFVDVFNRQLWSPERGKWTTYIRLVVWNTLLDDELKRGKHNNRWQSGGETDLSEFEDKKQQRLDMQVLLKELSDDAQLVLRMVLDTPVDIVQYARQKGGKEHRPNSLRKAVFELLRDMQWEQNRVSSVFEEIREALP